MASLLLPSGEYVRSSTHKDFVNQHAPHTPVLHMELLGNPAGGELVACPCRKCRLVWLGPDCNEGGGQVLRASLGDIDELKKRGIPWESL